ncbi:hypothetical protein [Dendrosporobacter sp. 1207_IL3150]|uniref:hypothetical protein n=1 Tax=Dendrosporobacter sp. 1207_IL3150 TaxID=3084054 RepID=UPI002FD90755
MPNLIVYKILKAAIIAAVFLILTGCTYDSQYLVNAVAKEPIKKTVWLAYWDLNAGEKDLQLTPNSVEKLSFFAAYFDKDDRVFVPIELSNKKSELNNKINKYETYLTFVNDKQSASGSCVMKDIEVLRRVFADDVTIEKHIDDIIALTLQGGYDGIEVDYERIWKDESVGKSFMKFADKLYKRAIDNNLKLRIVLEPRAPFASNDFPKGPEYVVMLYNLNGLHSDPGPKANKEFIQKTITKMKALPGSNSVAFSTGGCLWGSDGKKRFLTEAEAKHLADKKEAEIKRDEQSQCIVFEYVEGGITYQVWYADVKTLNYWISIAKVEGVNNISLWRLGGNIDINKII